MALGEGADAAPPSAVAQTLADALRAIAALPPEASLEEVAALISVLEPEDQRIATQAFLQSRASAPRTGKTKKRVILHPGSKRKEALTREQQAALLKVAGSFWRDPVTGKRRMDRPGSTISDLHGPQLRQLLFLMLYAGLHRDVVVDPIGRDLRCVEDEGEVMLRWNRIKKEAGGTATTMAMLPDDGSRAWAPKLVHWLRERETVFVEAKGFHSFRLPRPPGYENRGGIHPSLLDRILVTIGKEIGCRQRLTSYSIRHTTGANLAAVGLNAAQIADRMNCTVEIAKKYVHLSPIQAGREMRRMGALVAPGVLPGVKFDRAPADNKSNGG